MKGVVASGHPETSEAAAVALRAGGNAFDAVVAAGFAAAIAEPALTSLGGGGFALTRNADGHAKLFDFFVDTPGRAGPPKRELHFVPVTVEFPSSQQVFYVGLGSVAVPGMLKGLLHLHARLGRMPLNEVLEPVVTLARHGLDIGPGQAQFFRVLSPIMRLTHASRLLYEPASRPLQPGDRFANPDLADFLETLPNTHGREFYEGEIAAKIGAMMRDGGGLLSETDLAAFEVIEREPLEVDYRGYRLLTNPPPSFGGSLIALQLKLLAARDMDGLAFGGLEHLRLLSRVLQEITHYRQRGFTTLADLDDGPWHESLDRLPQVSRGTTHVSVSDAAGNVASLTSSGGEGSGCLVPGTGIMLNNMLGEDDLFPGGFHSLPPGVRVSSMMSPSALVRDGQVELVLGSGGSKRIRTAIFQVLSNVVDFGMNLGDAVRAPRIHWDDETLQVEPGFDPDVVEALARDTSLNPWAVQDVYFGGVHSVNPSGIGVGDARRGGHAVVVE